MPGQPVDDLCRSGRRWALIGRRDTSHHHEGHHHEGHHQCERLRVPREWFIPRLIRTGAPNAGGFVTVSRDRHNAEWQALVDADEPIVTQVDDGRTPPGGIGAYPSSSCSQPSLVLAMLDTLDVHNGHHVLEIGTGTGWNAALLAAAAGSRGRVTSLEVDPAVARDARIAVRRAGFSPRVVHADGTRGHPPDQPYDRVMATVSATGIPRTWIGQMRPGGVLVAPWGTEFCNGALLRMIVQPDGSARGRFGSKHTFMRLRNQRRHHLDPRGPELHTAVRSATTRRAQEIHQMVGFSHAAFTIGMLVPDCYPTVEESDTRHRIIELHDVRSRSWARVDLGHDTRTFTVYQFGPRRLWNEVDTAYEWWLESGSPAPTNYELSVAPDGTHSVDLRTTHGGCRWTLAPYFPFLATKNSPHRTRGDTQRGRGIGLGPVCRATATKSHSD